MTTINKRKKSTTKSLNELPSAMLIAAYIGDDVKRRKVFKMTGFFNGYMFKSIHLEYDKDFDLNLKKGCVYLNQLKNVKVKDKILFGYLEKSKEVLT